MADNVVPFQQPPMAGYKTVEIPKRWPFDTDAAEVRLEEVIGILDMLSDHPGLGATVDSVTLTALRLVREARQLLFGDEP